MSGNVGQIYSLSRRLQHVCPDPEHIHVNAHKKMLLNVDNMENDKYIDSRRCPSWDAMMNLEAKLNPDNVKYSKIVERLLYLAVRPIRNIAVEVSILEGYENEPDKWLW